MTTEEKVTFLKYYLRKLIPDERFKIHVWHYDSTKDNDAFIYYPNQTIDVIRFTIKEFNLKFSYTLPEYQSIDDNYQLDSEILELIHNYIIAANEYYLDYNAANEKYKYD